MQHFTDEFRRLGTPVIFNLLGQQVGALLVRKAVPDAVTSVDDELVILGPLHNLDVGLCGDGLILCGKIGHILVLEVANCSAER